MRDPTSSLSRYTDLSAGAFCTVVVEAPALRHRLPGHLRSLVPGDVELAEVDAWLQIDAARATAS